MLSTNLSPAWQPYCQMKTAPDPILVKKGWGSKLILENGCELLDCISSWWVNLHGHAHPEIADAIAKQARELEHVLFAGFTHEPAETAAQLLLELLPEGYSKVFFSDNGSTAMEVAVKQAYQFWHNLGENHKTQFIGFEGGYHGDTIGAMSVASRSVFNRTFEKMLFPVETIPYPETFIGDMDYEEKEEQALRCLEEKLAASDSYAAVIIEPLVQCPGGMRMCRPEFLQKLETVVNSYQTLMIYDEVAVGFGRTGDWFACSLANTRPDIIALSKGITGGFLPLSATVCTERVYAAFHSEDRYKCFMHGHTYMANPLACAAAVASMQLLKREPAAFRMQEVVHRNQLQRLAELSSVSKIRLRGNIAAFDLQGPDSGYSSTIGSKLALALLSDGILIRPLGSVVYLMPPYCFTTEELNYVYDKIYAHLKNN